MGRASAEQLSGAGRAVAGPRVEQWTALVYSCRDVRGRDIDLKALIRDVPDFPQPGVLFRDITPLLLDPAGYRYVIDEMTRLIGAFAPDAIVGVESRGFFFGAPVAYNLGVPLAPVRKAGKLPHERMSVEFALEYGEGQLDIHVDALRRGQSIVIVDDLLATGGTVAATAKLVELLGAQVKAMVFVVELAFLGGREALDGYEVIALTRYDEPA
jgi:adenine phosphoribosyltransferase